MQKNLFKNKNIFFILLIICIVLIILTGFISPLVISQKKSNWQSNLTDKIIHIENSVNDYFGNRQENLLGRLDSLKNEILKVEYNNDHPRQNFNSLLLSKYYDNYQVEVYKNRELIGWTNNVFESGNLQDISFDFGETYFKKSVLYTFLSVTDTLIINENNFILFLSLPVEKEYNLQNKYYSVLSAREFLNDKFHTSFTIEYKSDARPSIDGRNYSFNILNNFNNKIGTVTFQKPYQDSELASVREVFNTIQSVLAILALIIIGFGIFPHLKYIKSRLLRFAAVIIYLAIFRYALFYFNIFYQLFEGELTNSAYFSSAFAFGLVKSPLELLITIFFTFVISITAFNYIIDFYKHKSKKRNKFISAAAIGLSLVLYFLSLRGLGAAVRSVVFDSSLLYFNEPSLFSDFPTNAMLLNILLMGMSIVISSIVLIILIYSFSSDKKVNRNIPIYILIFLGFQILGYFYDLLQQQPQGTHLIRVVYIAITFFITYLVLTNYKTFINYVYFAFAGSVISISLLSYYNSELERESIKLTALEITRPNENWLDYVVRETLLNSYSRKEAIQAFKNRNSYEAYAFKIWSNSALQRESINSGVNFISLNNDLLGGFSFRFPAEHRSLFQKIGQDIDDVTVSKITLPYINHKIIRGLFPIKDDYSLLGYLEIAVVYDVNNISLEETPEFFASSRTYKNSVVDINKLNIYEFRDDSLTNNYGELKANREIDAKILNADFSKFNEAWFTEQINDEDYLFYTVRVPQKDYTRTLSVALKKRDLSFSLFDFFKVFFGHSILLITVILIFAFFNLIKNPTIKFTFRTQILIAFLIIAIIPLILLAVYFRNLTEERNTEAIIYKLGKSARNVENYINDYLSSSTLNRKIIFDKATRDLNVNYSLYKDRKYVYSSNDIYFKIGFISELINPAAYTDLMEMDIREIVLKEKIENYVYHSYYHKIEIGHEKYIIKVSDAFNSLQLPMSSSQLDVFLFGSYSLAVILIIILSAFIANQISRPVRRLTSATQSIASGDLSVQIENMNRGEIKDLISGFNYMVKELKKSQNKLAEVEREAAWREMAKQVAHEIKNPLTPMKLAIQQLKISYEDKSPKFDDIFQKVTNTIIQQIEILKNIASEFSSFARMPTPKLENVNFERILNETVNLFVDEKVNINIQSTGNSYIYADPDQLKRIVINLIRNSIQAYASVISLRLEEDSDYILFRITDNGKGISSENINKIFEPDFTTKEQGTGLGLSMAKRFVESIGAEIKLENTSPNGTTILIILPKSHHNG